MIEVPGWTLTLVLQDGIAAARALFPGAPANGRS